MSAGRCAYLGPRGTFCEQAVSALHPAGDLEPVAHPSIEAVLDAVRSGAVLRGVVPIESSVEGGVNATLDDLAGGRPLMIKAEVIVPVEFALLVQSGTVLADIKVVGGHPVAQPQCRRWLARNLPDAQWRAALSNADAAAQVADGHLDAALAGSFAARHYRLAILADDVHDNASAVTRFVEVGRPGPLPAATGKDRTSVVAFLADDHPGALMDILSQFAMRGVNLSRIESRPTGEGIGRYCFFIDCEGHASAPRVGEALMGLRRTCSDVRFLGSYVRADGRAAGAGTARGQAPADARSELADPEFADATAWLDRIRSGLSLSDASPTAATPTRSCVPTGTDLMRPAAALRRPPPGSCQAAAPCASAQAGRARPSAARRAWSGSRGRALPASRPIALGRS